MEFFVSLVKIAEALHSLASLISLIEAARSNPEITIALSIVLLAGAAAATILRRTRPTDYLSIR